MSDIRKSFAYQHLCDALKAEPTWTPRMVCVYNDYSDDLTERLLAAYAADHPKSPKLRARATPGDTP